MGVVNDGSVKQDWWRLPPTEPCEGEGKFSYGEHSFYMLADEDMCPNRTANRRRHHLVAAGIAYTEYMQPDFTGQPHLVFYVGPLTDERERKEMFIQVVTGVALREGC
jgi:hypothetical protein